MTRSLFFAPALLAAKAAAQGLNAVPYTDENTGIKFSTYTHSSGYSLGYALPENPTTTDFIAQLVAPITNDGGWAGFPLGQSMTGNLLIAAWPHDGQIISTLRQATGYTNPPTTTGDFKMTTIPKGTFVNETAFSYTFLCSNCIGDGKFVVGEEMNILGWAFSDDAITDPSSASSALNMHSGGFGAFGMTVADAKSADFDTWAAMATGAAPGPGNSTVPISGGNSTVPVTPIQNTTASIANETYDYIVCGGGPAGIIAAERIAESGASVLLLERGGASLAFTGNTDTLAWNSSVTMYDVPGFGYYQSKVGKPALCTDTADQAGCLLGGGTMINAIMFVKPQSRDFDDKWPQGWKWNDISEAADRLYERVPGQTYGSEDGLRYNNEAYDVLSKFFEGSGFKQTDFIKGDHNAKKDVYGYPPWMVANGLRSGPVRTYLPKAQKLSNFKLMLDTNVISTMRNGSTIIGVETETKSGERVIYKVKAGGRIILSAGAMSTPRILFNSGIGPIEQLRIVANGTSGVRLPPQSQWIDLPVGAEIKDHVIFTVKFNTSEPMYSPPVEDITSPNQTTVELFAKSSGLLSQSGQRLNFWTSVNTTSGKEMFIQGTCNGPANDTISMKVYLTHGLTSTGSLGISADGATEFTKEPWMQTSEDKEAITNFMNRLLKMASVSNSSLTVIPEAGSSANVTGADLAAKHTTASHYVGTAKMGTKGEAGVVVDTDAKVYGTDNLFVVDASIHADLPTGNTQSAVMIVAEHAAARILALQSGKTPTGTAPKPITTPSTGYRTAGRRKNSFGSFRAPAIKRASYLDSYA